HLASGFETRDVSAATLAELYDRWHAMAADPRILGGIYVVTPESVTRFDPQERALKQAILPPELLPAVTRPERFMPDLPAVTFFVSERPPTLLVLTVDTAHLTRGLMPELAKRYFTPGGYDVAVTHRDQVVFRSNAAWPAKVDTDPDVVAP